MVGSSWDADVAVTHLYAAHYKSLVRLAALFLHDVGLAEEVTQDAFVGMHRAWRRLDDPDKALAYLRTSVVNGARSSLRKQQVRQRHTDPAPVAVASAEQSAMLALEHRATLAALRELPVRQREVLILRYYADLSEADIADTLRISRGAVKSHASRGLAALRARLETP